MPKNSRQGFVTRTALSLIFSFAALAAVPEEAAAKVTIYDGSVSLGVHENEPPIGCWVEEDCGVGEVCRMTIRIEGPAAIQLLDALKRAVPEDEVFKDWGLSIFVSNDGKLNCDGTDQTKPMCTISLNNSTAELEGPLSCE